MKVACVLGRVDFITGLHLSRLDFDLIYFFSENDIRVPNVKTRLQRMSNPQTSLLAESLIVERCIERNICYVSSSGLDAELMRRALRLSELRVEARAYLNALNFFQGSRALEVKSVTFVARYMAPTDVDEIHSLDFSWLNLLHPRFLGLVPGLRRTLLLMGKFRAS